MYICIYIYIYIYIYISRYPVEPVPTLGATDCTPEIDTSEIMVDFPMNLFHAEMSDGCSVICQTSFSCDFPTPQKC